MSIQNCQLISNLQLNWCPLKRTLSFEYLKLSLQPLFFEGTLKSGQTMIYNDNYPADILMFCLIKDLLWVMRFQSSYVY